jgi:VanZ family protein
MKTVAKYWCITIIYMAIIFGLSSIPGDDTPPMFPFADKIAHVIEYMILGILLKNALNKYQYKYILAICIGSVYGITNEIHQLYVPGRECDIMDMVCNIIGCIIGQFVNFSYITTKCRNLLHTTPHH